MPRTKPARRIKDTSELDNLIKEYQNLTKIRLHKLDLDYKSFIENYERSNSVLLSRYPEEIRKLTINSIMKMQDSVKENEPPNIPQSSRKRSPPPPRTASKSKRVTTISDDGYQSESTNSSKNKMDTKRRSRSVSQDRRSKLSKAISKPVQKDFLKTPSSKRPFKDFVITPKCKPNSAVNILRKPRDGEMVFSTQGSPLLVSTTVNDRTANINVPLRNGNVVSLLPFHETSLSDDFNLDDETKHQLKILHSHLSKVLK